MAAKRAKFKVEELIEEKPQSEMTPEVSVDEKPVVEKESEKSATEVTPTETEKMGPVSFKDVSKDDVKDWLKDVKPNVSVEVERSSNFNMKIVLVLIVIVAIVGAITGGFYYYKKGVEKVSVNNQESKAMPVTVIPTQNVTPTPAVKVELDKLSVSILNGSGKVGEAGVVKALVVESGFTSGNISTGNAKTYDYEETTVALKEGISEDVFKTIMAALGEKYNVASKSESLEKSSKYDVVITVGKAK